MKETKLLVQDLDTPCAVVDLDVMENNLRRCQTYLDRYGLSLRPHIKTHKIPEFAHLQIKLGAKGANCQKLGEAEVMVDAGISDILLTYNDEKIRDCEQFARRIQDDKPDHRVRLSLLRSGKPYDKLKMPTFYLNDEEVHAIATFVLSNRTKFIADAMLERVNNDQAKRREGCDGRWQCGL